MKSSIKSSCFTELNNALKTNKKSQNNSKIQSQVQQNNLYFRSSSQAQNILLQSINHNNIDIFSQRNSNANLKLQQNTTNKSQKKLSLGHIKKNSIDKNANQQSPNIQSPRVIENEGGCQTSGRKSQQLNMSNTSINSTSFGNSKQILGQIKFQLAKSKQKTNSSTLSNSQGEFQLNAGYLQNNKNGNFDNNLVMQNQKNDSVQIIRTKSIVNINSPNQYNKTEEGTCKIQIHKNTGSKEKNRYVDYSYDQDIDTCLDEKINNYNGQQQIQYNDKENQHSNIQIAQQRKQNSNERYDKQKRNSTQDSFNGLQYQQNQQEYSLSQQLLMKKKSEGYIENYIQNNQIQQIQQNLINNDSFHDKRFINQNSNNISSILGRARSQEQINTDKIQELAGISLAATSSLVQPNQQEDYLNLSNTNQNQVSQTQFSLANKTMLLAQSVFNNQSSTNLTNNNNSSFNNANASSSIKKSSSKANLFQQKSPPQTSSKVQSITKQAQNSNLNIQTPGQQNKQNNSKSFQKNNNSFNLQKSNSSVIKNNQLNFSRGNAEAITENNHILFTDHNLQNNQKQQNLQSLINQNIPSNSFQRVASSSNINCKSQQAPARELIDNQNSYISDFQQFKQLLPQQKQQQQQQVYQSQLQHDSQKQKSNIDEYKKPNLLERNKQREQDLQNGSKSYLQSSTTQNISNLFFQNNTSNYQNSSNNIILNTQNDTQDGGSFCKNINNQNYIFDCKTNYTDTSYGQLGSSSTSKRILNQINKLKTPNNQQAQQYQHVQVIPIQQQLVKQSSSPKRKNSKSYIEKNYNLPSNSSLQSFYQSGLIPIQNHLNSHKILINGNQNTNINSNINTNPNSNINICTNSNSFINTNSNLNSNILNQNNLNSNENFNSNINICKNNNQSNLINNQNTIGSQQIQNFNAIKINTQQSDTNFTFQNNSQNPSQFALFNNTNTDIDIVELKNDNLNLLKCKNINIAQQNVQQLDKYATSQFQIKTQEDEQQNEFNNRRSSQQILTNQSFQQNQKNFSILFNNLFNSKSGNKQKNEDSNQKQNKILQQIKRNDSNSLLSTNPNIFSQINNVLNPTTQTEHSQSPKISKNNQNQIQQNNYIDKLHIKQNSSKKQLKQEFNEQVYPQTREPSIAQLNFNNQFDNQQNMQDVQFNQIENQEIQFNDKNRSKSQGKQTCIVSPLNLDMIKDFTELEFQQKRDNQLFQEKNKQTTITNQKLENEMKQIQIKMKNKLIEFKTSEQQWKEEKCQLLNQLESLQNQINFLTEENSLFKKSVSCNRQFDRQLNTSVSSSMEAVLQNF